MRTSLLAYALTAAMFGTTSVADAAPADREPPATNAAASQMRARLDSGIAEWRAARPKAKAAFTRVHPIRAPRVDGIMARVDDIVGRLDQQLSARRMTPVQLAGFAQELQSEEKKLKEELKKAREEAQAKFGDADARANQLLNILTGITQTMNEMRAGGCKGCL